MMNCGERHWVCRTNESTTFRGGERTPNAGGDRTRCSSGNSREMNDTVSFLNMRAFWDTFWESGMLGMPTTSVRSAVPRRSLASFGGSHTCSANCSCSSSNTTHVCSATCGCNTH
eukprot:scaffold28108_cov24-Attheya_sp.AAC.1